MTHNRRGDSTISPRGRLLLNPFRRRGLNRIVPGGCKPIHAKEHHRRRDARKPGDFLRRRPRRRRRRRRRRLVPRNHSRRIRGIFTDDERLGFFDIWRRLRESRHRYSCTPRESSKSHEKKGVRSATARWCVKDADDAAACFDARSLSRPKIDSKIPLA